VLELAIGPDGETYCAGCGVPARSATSFVTFARPVERATRVVAATMFLVLASFWIAACASQL